MSVASGDPLYRSDTRAAPSGAQQADLAPVSEQPSEHWEQQAAERAAEEPAAPTDPLGAQSPPDQDTSAEESDGTGSDGAQPESEGSAQAAPPSSAPSSSAPPAEASNDDPSASDDRSQTHQATDLTTTSDHASNVTVGGEMTWRDSEGEHTRSGEVSVDVPQATTAGASLTSLQEGSTVSSLGGLDALDTGVANGDLLQAVNGAGVTALTAGALDQVEGLTTTLSTLLDEAPALDGAVDSLSDALDVLPTHLGAGALPSLGSLDDALADPSTLLGSLPVATPVAAFGSGDATPASGGLLAALFTPQEESEGAPSSSSAGLPDIDLGGLLGSGDDGQEFDLPGL